jgi:regulator of sigma E protease
MIAYTYLGNWVLQVFFTFMALFGIGFLIGFHEFGHFIFCKVFNIKVPSFSFGMGPKIFTKKIGETEFALSAIPLGGYVEIANQEEGKISPKKDEGRYFSQKPYYQKMLVISGGIFFNILFAYIVFSGLYFFGMPKPAFLYHESTVISSIEKDSPAATYQLRPGDKILTIDNLDIDNKPLELIKYLKDRANKPAVLTIEHNGAQQKIDIIIGQREIGKESIGYLGVDFVIPRYGFFESIRRGISTTHMIIRRTSEAFVSIFRRGSLENIGGPIMLFSETIKGAGKGIKVFLLLLAFISVNLAVLNVIPLPILDGGQALFNTIEAIIGRPLPEKVKIYIHYACWIAILILILYISCKDIARLFTA